MRRIFLVAATLVLAPAAASSQSLIQGDVDALMRKQESMRQLEPSQTAPTPPVDPMDYLSLAKCIAYATLKGGVGGTEPVPQEYLVVIQTLGNRFMNQSAVMGIPVDEARMQVVTELVRLNRIKLEQGMDAVNTDAKVECSALAQRMKM